MEDAKEIEDSYSLIKIYTNTLTKSKCKIALMEALHILLSEEKISFNEAKFFWSDNRCVGERPLDTAFPANYPSNRKKVFDTRESFIKKAIVKHGDTYTYDNVVYVKSAKKVAITCKIHGDFMQTPNSHLCGSGCPKCSHTISPTQEQFLKRVQAVHGTTYDFSKSVYKSAHSKVCVICKQHGEFFVSPNSLYKGIGCPICGGSHVYSPDEFVEKCREVHAGIYDYSNTHYNSYYTPININCKKHGEFTQVAADHLHGRGCQECAKQASADASRKSLGTFITQSKEVHGEKYDYTKAVYNNTHTKLTLVCPIHGDFEISPSDHLHGYGCKKCSPRSRGEAKITEILSQWKILYKREVTFHDCRGTSQNSKLRFDFGVYAGESLILLIEYDGIQHYRPVFGIRAFNLTTKHDKIKDAYCISNKITLLRIPYWDFSNIEQILSNAIKEHKNEQETEN